MSILNLISCIYNIKSHIFEIFYQNSHLSTKIIKSITFYNSSYTVPVFFIFTIALNVLIVLNFCNIFRFHNSSNWFKRNHGYHFSYNLGLLSWIFSIAMQYYFIKLGKELTVVEKLDFNFSNRINFIVKSITSNQIFSTFLLSIARDKYLVTAISVYYFTFLLPTESQYFSIVLVLDFYLKLRKESILAKVICSFCIVLYIFSNDKSWLVQYISLAAYQTFSFKVLSSEL